MQKVKMTWKPTAAGIFDIVTGGFALIAGFFYLLVACCFAEVRSTSGFLTPFFLVISPVIVLLVVVKGGVCALQRKKWVWALVGSICAALIFPFLGIPAVVLTALSRDEFIKEHIRGPAIMLSDIYKLTHKDKVLGLSYKLQDLPKVLGCTDCIFVDRKAMLKGEPWCNAPEPPVIRGDQDRCYAFQSR